MHPLLATDEIVLKKKLISIKEHYDLEDRNGIKLGEDKGTLLQFPARFVIEDINGSMMMYIEGKTFSLRREFSLYDDAGKFLGNMKSKLLELKGQEYWLERNGAEFMRIFGNFPGHDYQMEVNGVQVAAYADIGSLGGFFFIESQSAPPFKDKQRNIISQLLREKYENIILYHVLGFWLIGNMVPQWGQKAYFRSGYRCPHLLQLIVCA